VTHVRLVVEKGKSKGKALRLKPSGLVTVGRDASTTLRIADVQASRKHFKIEAKLGEYVLEDLDSSNGTWVNGQRVTRHVLAPGDKVLAGETLVYFLEEVTSQEEASPADRRGELTGQELDGYRIGRLLGRGGMGTVYEAIQISLERTVAFKVLARELTLDPKLIEKFVAEARSAGRLAHPNVVAVFHVGSFGAVHYYSMEYMPGGSVDDLLAREGKLPLQRTIPIVFDAARGLEYAERQGLVHRDIKPGNLMLGQDEVAKIADLGLATWQPGATDACGSPHYVAPEQALGQPIDARVDLYALGATWYHMLTGDTPFSGQSAREVLLKQIHEKPAPIREKVPDLPPEAAALVHRLLEKDPAKRVATARQLQADLAELARRYPPRETVLLRIDAVAPEDPPSEELLEGEAPAASSATTTPLAASAASASVAPAPPSGRTRWLGLVAAAALLAAGAFAATLAVGQKLVESGTQERQATEQALERVKKLVDAGDPAAEGEAIALAERLEVDGEDEAAVAARGLARTAAEAARLARQTDLASRLDAIERALASRGKGADDDPAVAACLDQARTELTLLAVDAKDEPVGAKARLRLAEVGARLEKGIALRREKAEQKAALLQAVKATKDAIDQLLADGSPERYRLAFARTDELQRSHGALPGSEGERLTVDVVSWLRGRAASAAKETAADALRKAGLQEWSAARAVLDTLVLDDPALAAPLEAARQTIAEAERGAAEAQRGKVQRDARERRQRAIDATAPARGERRFGDAASALRADAPLVGLEAERRLVELRARRLEGAGRALDRVAAHVRGGGRRLKAQVAPPNGAARDATAVEVDAAGRRYFFEFERSRGIGQDVVVERLRFEELAPVLDAEATADLRLDAASLAFEIGDREAGQRRLVELERLPAVAGDPALAARARELLDLAVAEAP
jgi:serine/threonine protein kinase